MEIFSPTTKDWWNRLKNWTVASTQGPSRELVESFLASRQAEKVFDRFDSYAKEYGRFPQILRNKKFPKDRADQKGFKPKFPRWLDYEVTEWVGPKDTKGYIWRFFIGSSYLEVHRPWIKEPEWKDLEL